MLKCEYQRVKKTSSRKHLNLTATITIRFKFKDLHGEDVIALTKSQVDRLVKAYEEKKGLSIRMSKTQLAHNTKLERGFTSVSWIDSIPNWNCLTSYRS